MDPFIGNVTSLMEYLLDLRSTYISINLVSISFCKNIA